MAPGSSGSSSSAAAGGGTDGTAVANAPHQLKAPRVDYTIVIPTLGRWRPAREVNPSDRSLANTEEPFILVRTLAFLGRHGMPKGQVVLFVADDEDRRASRYRSALARTGWEGTRIVAGVRGIREQRNFIRVTKYFPERAHIVSIDDDVSDVLWKNRPQGSPLLPLPHGALESLIFDAFHRMKTYRAFICGLASTVSKNSLSMFMDGISTRNGEVNGFFYCFINRHDTDLLPTVADATEDAERSLRYFRKDRRVLRYRMYCGSTRCFQNQGGLQSLFGTPGESTATVNERRKTQEREAAVRLHEMFPELTGKPKQKTMMKTLEIHFRPMGGAVIPSTTPEEYKKNMAADMAAMPKRRDKQEPKKASSEQPPPLADAAAPCPPLASSGAAEGPGAAPSSAQGPAAGADSDSDTVEVLSDCGDGGAADEDDDDGDDEDAQLEHALRVSAAMHGRGSGCAAGAQGGQDQAVVDAVLWTISRKKHGVAIQPTRP
ncbi:unnamed protein product [Prorocentrum cordatum]|uniref:Hexosyltransferase n=1 Tax=Prorocentrum cordatum TaxID=2364126 RepID=A0ABN9X167_9DINO|nr:unnamed protein product [Polarella glacialis]